MIAAPAPQVPTPLPPRFELLERAGSGNSGEVFRAYDRKHRAEVAVKRLRHVEPRALRSFKREIAALADRRHPNIVALHELTWIDDQWLLVMEWVPGQGLLEWCGRDVSRWRAALPQIAAGLESLHEIGFLHRDLAPGNVRVTPDGRVVLLDFGLAAPRGAADRAWGEIHALAPEQLGDAPLEPAADWYALGALIYRGWAGRPVFEGRGAQVLGRKRSMDAPPLRGVAPDTPEDLAALADALLLREPEARMRAARPLLRALGVRAETPREPPFVGRAREIAAVHEALAGVREGACAHVRIRGPSGIGKSALAAHLGAVLATHAEILSGRAHERHAFPFAGLDEIVEQLASRHPALLERSSPFARAALAAMFPTLGLSGPALPLEASLDQSASALREILATLTAERPVVITIDDAQWADVDGMRLLGRVLGGTVVRCLLVTIVRAGEGTAALRELDARVPPERELELGPLSPDETRRIAEALDRDDGDRIQRASGGMPLFAVMIARGAEGATLDEALALRVASLPEAERRTLQVLAVAGRPIERGLVVESASRRGVAHPFGALGGLRAERLVVERHGDGVAVELAHSALSSAALQRVGGPSGAMLSELHAALDDAIQALGVDDPELEARHALGAGRVGRAAVSFERAATRALAGLAFEHAAELAGQALELVPPSERDRRRLLHRVRADALAAAGHGEAAAQAYGEALDGRPIAREAPETIELARLRAEQLFHAGRLEHGYAAFEGVLGALGMALPPPRAAVAEIVLHQLRLRGLGTHVRARASLDSQIGARRDLCLSVGIALTNVDSFRGAAFVLRSLWLAERAGDPVRYGHSLAYVAAYACNGGRRTAKVARALIERAQRVADQTCDPFVVAMTSAARCLLAFHAGRYDESLRLAIAIEASFRAVPGAIRERVTAQIYRCASLAMRGDWDELAVQRQRLLEDGEARGDRFAQVNARSGVMNLLWLVRDEPERARSEADRAMADWTDHAVTVQHFFDLLAQARIDLYVGDPDRAIERIERLAPRLRRALLQRKPFVAAHLHELRARAELLRPRPDERVVRRAIRGLRAERATWITPLADAIEASLRARQGLVEHARAAIVRAHAGFESHGMAAHAGAAARFEASLRGEVRDIPGARDPVRFARMLGVTT